jgi:hypothetical protein
VSLHQPERGRVTRRALVGAGGLVLLGLASGCGIRLEDDAPRLPLLPGPTRAPVADEAMLLRALAEARSLAALARAVAGHRGDLPDRLARLHRQQATTLQRMLTGAGVPVPTGSPDATPSARPVRRRGDLARLEARAVSASALERLGTAGPSEAPVLGAMTAQRAAAAVVLGGDVRWPATPGLARDTAASLLKATRPAVYAFEVVAAQTDHALRQKAGVTLDALRSQRDRLERAAGAAAPPPAIGYDLPFPVHDAAAATRLARWVLGRLVPQVAVLLGAAAGDRDTLTAVVHALADGVALGERWQVPLEPFPGLRTPS